MLPDRAFRAAFRNFSTLLLLAAAVAVPLHLIASYVWRDVIAVDEIHAEITEFPPDRKVGGVGSSEVAGYRRTGWVVSAVELALLPLLVVATGRVLVAEAAGDVPTVTKALFGLGRQARRFKPAPESRASELVVPVLVAGAVWFLARKTGLTVTAALPDDTRWAGVALVEALARSAGAPFLFAACALAARARQAA